MKRRVSYECEEVIEDLKRDIAEFGPEEPAWGVWVNRSGYRLLVNYLIGKKKPTQQERENGEAVLSTLGELLQLFEQENQII